MINRGTEDYTNVRFGAFTDFDLGSFQDDLAGCDSSLSLFHVYNGDAMDDSSSTSTGYGADIPAQGVMFLNHPMTAHRVWTFWDNAILLEDAMNGTTSGTPFTQLGYPTHFQFPGGAWTEQTSGNAPGDRRSVGSVGPFTLAAGGSLCVDLAYPFARAESGDPLDSRDVLLARAAALRTWYAGQAWDCSEVLNIITGVPQRNSALSFSVFPNPTRERFTVQVASEAVGADLRVLDPSGRQVWTGRLYSTTMTFDVAGLRNGCYLLEMVSGEGLRQVQHFIVAD